MRLARDWIAEHIPHAGRMCLLDEVIAWSDRSINCRTGTHRDPHNPLRCGDRLGIACGIEYAAQAMAVHGALRAGALDPARRGGRVQGGFLAGLRGLTFHVLRLDDLADDLTCDAACAAGDSRTALYDFELRAGSTRLLEGRATVILDAAPEPVR